MTVIALTLVAAFLGGLVGGWLNKPKRKRRPLRLGTRIDPLMATEIDRAAANWAAMSGEPAAEQLLAEKLRMAFMLRDRPPHDSDERRW